MEITKYRECWLGKFNGHLDNPLEKANGNTQMLRHMVHHYQTKNEIFNIKVKEMQNKLKETLKDTN